MEIITTGTVPKYSGACTECLTTLEAKRKELTASKDNKSTEVLTGVCPLCGNTRVIFTKKV